MRAMRNGQDSTTGCSFACPMKQNAASNSPPRSAKAWMPDVFTKAKRSDVMSRIRSRGNKDTELALAKLLRANGIKGWRRHASLKFQISSSKFQVKPDFVFRKLKLAMFVDGCFWHGCPKHSTKPQNNRTFWQRKFSANKTRDQVVTRTLKRAGWRVLRLWEHERARKNAARLMARLDRVLM
jgi:DNA mismatch endonuclease (patch repair protein)